MSNHWGFSLSAVQGGQPLKAFDTSESEVEASSRVPTSEVSAGTSYVGVSSRASDVGSGRWGFLRRKWALGLPTSEVGAGASALEVGAGTSYVGSGRWGFLRRKWALGLPTSEVGAGASCVGSER